MSLSGHFGQFVQTLSILCSRWVNCINNVNRDNGFTSVNALTSTALVYDSREVKLVGRQFLATTPQTGMETNFEGECSLFPVCVTASQVWQVSQLANVCRHVCAFLANYRRLQRSASDQSGFKKKFFGAGLAL